MVLGGGPPKLGPEPWPNGFIEGCNNKSSKTGLFQKQDPLCRRLTNTKIVLNGCPNLIWYDCNFFSTPTIDIEPEKNIAKQSPISPRQAPALPDAMPGLGERLTAHPCGWAAFDSRGITSLGTSSRREPGSPSPGRRRTPGLRPKGRAERCRRSWGCHLPNRGSRRCCGP